ncbi:MAG: VCBS repeat-containing protein [Oscillochloris sp.]|nr:VCBS repeat-containing protein [Oscillochloris sp.]
MSLLPSRIFVGLVVLITLAASILVNTPVQAFEAGQRSGFPKALPGQRVDFGSPTLADLDNDGKLEIIVGGMDGIVYVVRQDGSLMWQFNAGAAINAAANARPDLAQSNAPVNIRSAPAVGDITGDGKPEVVIGAGDVTTAKTHGGVVALSAAGQLLPGWPFLTIDNEPRGGDNLTEGVVSSPAIGDVDGDGLNEVVFGAFDHRIWVLGSNATVKPGWPKDVLDTIWSSPALADFDNDGVKEIVIGIDAHRYRGPDADGTFRETFDGGYISYYEGDGTLVWSSFHQEIVTSSPAVADLDGNGDLEIVVGSGTYYSNLKKQPLCRSVTAWNHDGSLHWRTPVNECVPGSPAIADLDGNGTLEVVIGTRAPDSRIYVLNGASGAVLRSHQPTDIFNTPSGLGTPVLGDYDGDGRDDVFVSVGWDVVVLRGTDLAQLTSNAGPGDGARPSYYAKYLLNNTPAVGDLDGNGKLELVAAGGSESSGTNARINVWNLDASSAKASWPMFRGRANHQGVFVPRQLLSSLNGVATHLTPGSERSFTTMIDTNDGSGASWTVQENDPKNVVTLNRNSGGAGDTLQVTVSGDAGDATATLTVKAAGVPDVVLPVNIFVSETIYKLYLPTTFR